MTSFARKRLLIGHRVRTLFGYLLTMSGVICGLYLLMSTKMEFRQHKRSLQQQQESQIQVFQREVQSPDLADTAGHLDPVFQEKVKVPVQDATTELKPDWLLNNIDRDIHNRYVLSTLPVKTGCTEYQNKDIRTTIGELAIDNVIVIAAFIDKGYVDTAQNFYITSILPHGIKNVVFFCIDESACKVAWQKCIPALLYVNHVGDDQIGAFETEAFFAKSRLKLKLVQQILEWGYTVLLTDVDIWYFDNPLKVMNCSTDCDILVQNDNLYLNTGFNLIRPTVRSLEWYRYLVKATEEWKGAGDDQRIFNEKYHIFQKNHTNATKLQLKVLDIQRFPVALVYYEENHRYFPWDNPCEDCVIVHNNWLFGTATKVYRFKEHFMWFIDTNGYYSDPDAKYLIYDQPPLFDDFETSRKWENRALQNALIIGNITNRIVILPRFTCENTTEYKCPLNSHYRLASFNTHFIHNYRESTFLEHPLVPKPTKRSISPIIRFSDLPREDEIHKPNKIIVANNSLNLKTTQGLYNFDMDLKNEMSSDRILHLTKPFADYKVLHFYSLYYAQVRFSNGHLQAEFSKRLQEGLVKSDYEQRLTQG